jgi:hypothetical protein
MYLHLAIESTKQHPTYSLHIFKHIDYLGILKQLMLLDDDLS